MRQPRILQPFLAPIAVILLIAGCSRDRDTPSPQLQATVAVWEGGRLTLGEWLHSFRELSSPDSVDTQKLQDAILQMCHEWVSEKVLAERARENGLHRDPKMVDKLTELREDKLVALYLRKNIDEKIVIRKRDLKTFYEENRDRFMSPATYTYYRIFVSNEKHGKEEAERRARECWTLIEKGANFHDMVAEYSDTREDRRNLEYGPFKAGEMPAEVEKVILETPLRSHSPVIEVPEGYMILYPQSKTEAVARSYSSVEMTVYQELFAKEQSTQVDALLKDLNREYKVVTHADLFDAAEVKPEAILLEINPGGAIHTWQEFQNFSSSRNASSRAEKEGALEMFARRKLLLNHARQTKFDETDYFRKRFRPVEARVLSDYFLEIMVDSKVELSDEEIENYYDENPEEFRRPARIEAWHLAKKIRYPVNASEKDRATEERKVLGQLLEIRRRIAEQGESFVTWANRFTDYADGGYLGWQPMLALPPEWISVVATLEEGEISLPIRVRDTFELVLRGGLEEAGILKLEVARDKVIERAKGKKIAETRRLYLEALLAELSVTYKIQPALDLVVRLLDRWKRPPQYWLDPYQ